MEKWLCWGSLGVSGLLLLLFLLDLILGMPFGFQDTDKYVINIIGIVSCGLVGYLAWESFKDLR